MHLLFIYAVPPQSPRDIKVKYVTATSVKLCWEQAYDTEDEKPTNYCIMYLDLPNSVYTIDPTFYDVSPYKQNCEFVLDGLKPTTTYKVVIIAENDDGEKSSEEVSITTVGKYSVKLMFFYSWNTCECKGCVEPHAIVRLYVLLTYASLTTMSCFQCSYISETMKNCTWFACNTVYLIEILLAYDLGYCAVIIKQYTVSHIFYGSTYIGNYYSGPSI